MVIMTENESGLLYGNYIGLEDVEIEEDDSNKVLYILRDNPKIQLDDGRIVYGFECFWSPVETNLSTSV